MDGDSKPIYGVLQHPLMGCPFTDNPIMKITDYISANLNAWMEASDVCNTEKKLARRAGVGTGTVQRYRKGEGNPTITNLCAISRAFNRRVEDLLAPPAGQSENVVRFSANGTPAPYCATLSPVESEIIDLVNSMEERGQWELVGEARMLARMYPKQKNLAAPR